MSDELNNLKDEVSESVSKFAGAPRVKQAWDAASLPLKVAGGALVAGLLIKPALLVAFGAAAYGAYKGITAYTAGNDGSGTPPASGPRDFDM